MGLMNIGGDSGGLRSRQAQRYAHALISANLMAYKKQVSVEHLAIQFFDTDLLKAEHQVYYQHITEIKHQADNVTIEPEILAVEADEEREGAEEDPAEDEEQVYRRLPREKPFALKQTGPIWDTLATTN